MTNISDYSPEQLTEYFKSKKITSFRTKQILEWVYRKPVLKFDEMTDLPKTLRDDLAADFSLYSVRELIRKVSIDGTNKALFELGDGESVETALIPSGDGFNYTICVSCQVGCPMGCAFCSTGHQGFQRNLSVSEIVDQVRYFNALLGSNGRISNVVFMGMGEPFSNYDNVIRAANIMNADWGINIAARSITISTVGVISGIRNFMREGHQFGLAVSLHAPSDQIRNRLLPYNKSTGVDKLLKACRDYVSITNRRITFEYCLFKGINDTREVADELIDKLKGLNCHVNLIAPNATFDHGLQPSESVLDFENYLKDNHINVTLRKSMGSDIDAACGQLKSNSYRT